MFCPRCYPWYGLNDGFGGDSIKAYHILIYGVLSIFDLCFLWIWSIVWLVLKKAKGLHASDVSFLIPTKTQCWCTQALSLSRTGDRFFLHFLALYIIAGHDSLFLIVVLCFVLFPVDLKLPGSVYHLSSGPPVPLSVMFRFTHPLLPGALSSSSSSWWLTAGLEVCEEQQICFIEQSPCCILNNRQCKLVVPCA